MLNSKARLPLYVQVKNHILDLIAGGDYPPGTRLPTENELMTSLGVGRATVRAALSELEFEGKVDKRHGIGTFVSAVKSSYSFEPLVSLTYSLRQLGTEIENDILFCDYVKPEGELFKVWAKEERVGFLKRIRKAGSKPVAIEDSYFLPDIFETVRKLSPGESVAHALLSFPGMEIERIDMSIVVRKPEKSEQDILELELGENVAQMNRWVYKLGEEFPVNFVRFVLPVSLMGLSNWKADNFLRR
ncbi:MAG TPA: GntR family transcriptional regulator [Clostridiales bacterium]|jgi:DNA-binding GntR family transcriptional regulator|nr:GntR family transcriptional regulator [Clostridiales bacterium]